MLYSEGNNEFLKRLCRIFRPAHDQAFDRCQDDPEVLNARVQAALIDELMLEDRINDEVRLILEAYQEEMRRTGASYQEMFKKIKQELARKYKAVL